MFPEGPNKMVARLEGSAKDQQRAWYQMTNPNIAETNRPTFICPGSRRDEEQVQMKAQY